RVWRLLAPCAVQLHRSTGQDDLAVGSPVANRGRVEVEGLIGFFVNPLVLRLDCAGAPGFRQLLARVRRSALGAFAHQDLPFERVVEELRPQRDPSRAPLFQILFALQNAAPGAASLPGLDLQPVEVEESPAKFDLTVTFAETPDGLAGTWGYNRDLFDAAAVVRM